MEPNIQKDSTEVNEKVRVPLGEHRFQQRLTLQVGMEPKADVRTRSQKDLLPGTHQASGLAKDGRKTMKDLYYWAEPIDQFPISIPIIFKSLCSVLK
jgi:hypothetical protein